VWTHFCERCILRWLEVHDNCPVCRRGLTKSQLAADMSLRRKIRNLPDKCHLDAKQCLAKGTVGRDGNWWIQHGTECSFFQLPCPLCNIYSASRQTMSDHLLRSCMEAYVGCKYQCGLLLARKNITEHEVECAYRPVECKDCKAKIAYVSLKVHISQCKMISIPCDFHFCGCKTTFLRRDLSLKDKHLQEHMSYHMSLLLLEIRTLKLKVAKLEGFDQPPDEDGDLLPDLKDQQQQERSFTWSLPWCDPKLKTYSGSLTEAFGGRWGFAYGSKRASADDIPIFIKCHDLTEKSILIDYGIAAVDPRNGEEMKQYKKLAREFQKNDEYGYTSLISLSELEKAGAFDRSKGLTTLIFRARLRLASR